MAQDERTASPAGPGDSAVPPGIRWEPGDEDYPFASIPGETALDFFERWLAEAG
jgi:hypothetical protein